MAWPCVAAGVVRSCSVGDENSFGLNSSGVLIVPPTWCYSGYFGDQWCQHDWFAFSSGGHSVAIKSVQTQSSRVNNRGVGDCEPDKAEKWGGLRAGATFERALFAFLSPTCFTTDQGSQYWAFWNCCLVNFYLELPKTQSLSDNSQQL